MIAGLSGALLSHDAVDLLLKSSGPVGLARAGAESERRALRAWHRTVEGRLGPAAGARTVFDLLAEPLVQAMGFTVVPVASDAASVDALLRAGGVAAAALVVTPWAQPSGAAWRHAVHRALAHGVRWCVVVNGPAVCIFDADRAYARRYAEFTIATALDNDRTYAALRGLLHAAAFSPEDGSVPAIGAVVRFCELHRAEVRSSLRAGVHDALVHFIAGFRAVAARRPTGQQVLDESLIVVYRILFLLFAEARGLVPAWHPVYRDGYTIESVRRHVRARSAPAGVWETLQAVARLAHRGCRAGTLRVPPFNGRLFSPAEAPLADALPLDDDRVGRALVALTTRRGKDGPEEISYADLGVEQLGSVYENLLDYDLATGDGAPALVRTGRRKATGSFYTPRGLTDFLVRRTLAPLVRDAAPEKILSLRVLDPAMGSGAFLVGACRYLAAAYQQSLIAEGTLTAADVTDEDRAGFRRAVAQRCLFGVDVNPMAVQLGRLSLWLATLAADKPLSFLDHHLRTGNSLVGASMQDIVRTTAGRSARRLRDLPLFGGEHLHAALESAVSSRLSIAETPDDTVEQVRRKERATALLHGPDGPVKRWTLAGDLWCAEWYARPGETLPRGTFRAVLDRILLDASALPRHTTDPLIEEVSSAVAPHKFFHWTLEFPEIFHDGTGAPLPNPGFDAVIGNPPWEMLRQDEGAGPSREMHRFVRGSGVYRMQGKGHANLYQLFVERTLGLLKRRGRAGLVLPAGFANEHSAAALRRRLFDTTVMDTFTILENRDGIFPIHRSLKFLLLTFEHGGATRALPARTAVRTMEALDSVSDLGDDPAAVHLPRTLLERSSGDSLAVPEIRTGADLAIVSAIACGCPALSDRDGWGVHFGRELNATDDQPNFRTSGAGLPVLEGKHLHAFRADTASTRYRIPAAAAARLLDPASSFGRPRLAYRDIASPTNRTTLIAAVVPSGAVTTHTIFCLKEQLDLDAQHFLCGIFNSYVANYLVRMRVGTHVSAALIARLRVPKPDRSAVAFRRIVALARALAVAPSRRGLGELNARVASLYGVSRVQFAHVLGTFPLVAEADRLIALDGFSTHQGEVSGS